MGAPLHAFQEQPVDQSIGNSAPDHYHPPTPLFLQLLLRLQTQQLNEEPGIGVQTGIPSPQFREEGAGVDGTGFLSHTMSADVGLSQGSVDSGTALGGLWVLHTGIQNLGIVGDDSKVSNLTESTGHTTHLDFPNSEGSAPAESPTESEVAQVVVGEEVLSLVLELVF